MEKEVRITPPEGYVIDKENSTFECVKFKPIKEPIKDCLTYNDIARELFFTNPTFYFTTDEDIALSETGVDSYVDCLNCTSGEQAEKLLAINRLMNVAKYLNGDWRPNWEDYKEEKFCLQVLYGTVGVAVTVTQNFGCVHFKSFELAQKAIKILGEDTVRLALSTDW